MADQLPATPTQIAALEAASGYARQSLAPGTLAGYRSDWAHFTTWCRAHGWQHLPAAPETVAAFLAALATSHGRSALSRRVTAIGHAHRIAGEAWDPKHPVIHHTLRGILRRHGAPPRLSAAITTDEIKRLIAPYDVTAAGVRDRALLLLGYAGALRRSELAGIHREHLIFAPRGLRLLLPRSKADQVGRGVEIGIPKGSHAETCPVRALEDWLVLSACAAGPVFRKVDRWGNIRAEALHPDAVRQILGRRAQAAGLEAETFERISPHGLRSGFITAAYAAGARDEEIMSHSRRKDYRTMRGYVRRAKLIMESPAGRIGL